ncbi:helix-turn-helix domain-containing protein [Flavobacterium restrictum]|uniref:Helix-turn-helix transcriptional regulator n=1 Tax=Flavobacterium restrictum TaxID=2594428 RepID=A0A553DWE4_9FLAO|nr:AraC family transcriptional regulator [Flavobacterium restrictum]TRX37097.1 helix-turn-helix transcriptional regulator [Flavobacterium restrictum]
MHPYISILTIFLALLLAYHNWNINRNSIFLSGFIVLFALYSLIHYVLLINKNEYLLAIFYNNTAPTGYLVGPLFYFYVRGVLFDKSKLSRKDFLHLTPALINIVSITPYLFTPFAYKLALAHRLIKDVMVAKTETVGLYPNIINIIARPVLLCFYVVLALVMLFRFWAKTKTNNRIPKKQTRNMLLWLFGFILIIIATVICYGVLTYLFLKDPNPNLVRIKTSTPMAILGFCLLMIPVSLLVFPELLYGIPQTDPDQSNDFQSGEKEIKNNIFNQAAPKEINSPAIDTTKEVLSEKDIEPRFIELSQSILVYIKESEIYLNPNFSMEELSREMDVPKHHLYYCFNSVMNLKLTKIRAELRVEYAKKLIEQGSLDTLTLDAVASKAGFSSRSSFQSTFKDEVGCSPGEYLKILT